MKLLPLALFSIALGLLTSVLAAFIFLIWFDAYWRRHEIDAHLSAAMPSPSVRCDGGMEGDEADEIHTCGDCGAELQIVRPGKYQCVNPKCPSNAPVLEDVKLPDVFEAWIKGKGLR